MLAVKLHGKSPNKPASGQMIKRRYLMHIPNCPSYTPYVPNQEITQQLQGWILKINVPYYGGYKGKSYFL
jgi:hypothetical protein